MLLGNRLKDISLSTVKPGLRVRASIYVCDVYYFWQHSHLCTMLYYDCLAATSQSFLW